MQSSKWLFSGLVLLVLALAYHVLLTPRIIQRIPSGWRFDMLYVGTQTNALQGDTLPTKDVLSQYKRTLTVVSEKGRPDSVAVQDQYLLTEIGTGKVQYDYTVNFLVDPRSGASITHPGEIFLFPRGVEKKTYRLRASYLKGLDLRFMREDEVENLNTYLFGYEGGHEYTDFFEGIIDGRKREIPDGQEVRCANDLFRYRVWVEPKTGIIVKVDESCSSGDYAYDKVSGKRLYPLDRFAGVTEGDDLARHVDRARLERLRITWLGRVAPLLFAGTGLICVIATLRRRRSLPV